MTPDEKEEISKVIPHNYVIFKVNAAKPATEVKLKSAEWAIITQIDGKKTIEEIANNLALTEDESLVLFYNLHQNSLIEIKLKDAPEQEYAPKDFFKQLEVILVKVIGPVANYIIDDVLWDLDEKRDKFLKDKIPVLTESISQEIEDPQKKVEFQREMLELIKTI